MWHLIDDPDDFDMRYLIACDESPYIMSVEWSANLEDIFNVPRGRETYTFCTRIISTFGVRYSADTLDELKLIIMLES